MPSQSLSLQKTTCQFGNDCVQRGLSSWHAGNKFGFKKASTDIEAALEDNTIRDVVITTRHNNHADLVLKSLKHEKYIRRKPLCLTISELEEIKALYTSMVNSSFANGGFNRRFISFGY